MSSYSEHFDKLTKKNHKATSPITPLYNCIAWAASDPTRWWQPDEPFDMGYYWPAAAPKNMHIDSLIAAFGSIGYEVCKDGNLVAGVAKVVLYANERNEWTHAARQLKTGKWTSKLGKLEDIEHDSVDDVAGAVYGSPYCFMAKTS